MISVESMSFIPDNIVGSTISPYKIDYMTSATSDLEMNKFKIYPNPVNDIIRFDSDHTSIEQIEIIDNLGRVIMSNNQLTINTINVSNLIPGVYTLRIKNNGKVSNHIFIKK